jgi:transposase
MDKHYPPEFKADVVAMPLKGEVTKRQIAENVGISETPLFRWIHPFEVDQGEREGTSSDARPS